MIEEIGSSKVIPNRYSELHRAQSRRIMYNLKPLADLHSLASGTIEMHASDQRETNHS